MEYLHFNSDGLQAIPRIPRLTLINALTGFKSANLIGTINPETGVTNAAIFSSAVHIGSNPALFGLVTRPVEEPRRTSRHTYENIQKTGFYTINHVHKGMIKQAHQSSASYPDGVSEFDAVGLTPVFSDNFAAPYVAESPIRMGLVLREEISIKSNNTILLIGEIVELFLPKAFLSDDFHLDLAAAGTVALSGLDRYYSAEEIGCFPYARV